MLRFGMDTVDCKTYGRGWINVTFLCVNIYIILKKGKPLFSYNSSVMMSNSAVLQSPISNTSDLKCCPLR